MKGPLLVSLVALLAILPACSGDPIARRDKFFESGQSYVQEGKLEEAAIQFRNALQLDGQFVPGHLALAQTLQKVEDHEGAYSHYRRAASLDDTQLGAKLQMGRYHLFAGGRDRDQFKRAKELAEEILALEPDNIEARILLGNASAGLDDIRSSIGEMEKVLSQDPSNLTASINLGIFRLKDEDVVAAEQIFRETVERNPDSDEALRALGNFYLVSRRFGEAERHFERAFEIDPKSIINLYSLVRLYMAAGRRNQVEGVYKRAIEADSQALAPQFGLANYYLAGDRASEGLRMLEDLVQRNPDERQLKWRLAEVYLNDLRLSDAEPIIVELLKTQPEDGNAIFLEGRLQLARGERDEAMQKFEKAIELNAELVPAYLQKASVHMQKGDFDLAHDAIEGALRVNRNHPLALAAMAKILVLKNQYDDAILIADRVLELYPNAQDALAARAEAYLIQKKLDRAEKDFLKLFQQYPDISLYNQRLGNVAVERGQHAKALTHFKRALELNPDNAEAMNDISALFLRRQEYAAALEQLTELEKRAERKDLVYALRSRVYELRGDMDKAEAEIARAIAFHPDNIQLHVVLGRLKISQGKTDEAIQEVDRLLVKDENSVIGHLLKAMFLEQANRPGEAAHHYRKSYALDPGNHVAANNLAWLYCQREERMQEALELASQARQKAPDNPLYADTLGWVQYKMGNYLSAVNQLKWAVDNSPQPTAENYYRLGMAYYRSGDNIHAGQTLRKAIQLDPAFPQAEEAKGVLRELG